MVRSPSLHRPRLETLRNFYLGSNHQPTRYPAIDAPAVLPKTAFETDLFVDGVGEFRPLQRVEERAGSAVRTAEYLQIRNSDLGRLRWNRGRIRGRFRHSPANEIHDLRRILNINHRRFPRVSPNIVRRSRCDDG